MEDSMVKNLEGKTGVKLTEWIAIVQKSKLEKHKQIIDYLKSEHDLTYGYANLIAHKFRKSDAGSVDDANDLIEAQYAKKPELRPIYDAIMKQVNKLGKELEIAPKKAYVSLRRKKQFAIIQPSTKTRLDLGLNLKGKEITERLEASGSFNSMVSHRVRLTDVKEVDKELTAWIIEAFEAAG